VPKFKIGAVIMAAFLLYKRCDLMEEELLILALFVKVAAFKRKSTGKIYK
jgi:hypothetical protein